MKTPGERDSLRLLSSPNAAISHTMRRLQTVNSLFSVLVTLLAANLLAPFAAQAQEVRPTSSAGSLFDFKIENPEIKRSSVYWFPLAGFVLPGLPQFINDQEGAGAVYSGAAGLGLAAALATSFQSGGSTSNQDYGAYSDQQKIISWSFQLYQTSGSLSTYHAFRSAAEQRRAVGDFTFLESDNETSAQLLVAPFKVGHFIEPAVFIPLGVIAGGLIIAHNSGPVGSKNFSLSDGLFTLGTSYNAGVGEEALFRGYLMMNLRQSWNSDFWSLATTATIFAAAHLSTSNPLPLPQLVLGSYLGWLTQHDHWTLSRAVFVHAWWDIIAFAATFSTSVTDHTLYVPLLDFQLN